MKNQNDTSLKWAKKTGASLGAIALGITALVLPGCTNTNQAEETNVTTEDVAETNAVGENAANVTGQEVTVRSTVEEAIGKTGLLLQSNGNQPVLVVNATGAPFVAPEDNIPIQVTGEVVPLVVADLEREYSLQLEDELYADYVEQPAIVAQSLALAPTPEILTEQPMGYFNKTIAVEGDLRKLEDTNNAFALFEEGWVDDVGVLVIGVEENLKGDRSLLDEGGNVTVTGVAQPFSPQLVEQAGLGWTPQQIDEFSARYNNRPVIVADGVYPSAVDPAPGS